MRNSGWRKLTLKLFTLAVLTGGFFLVPDARADISCDIQFEMCCTGAAADCPDCVMSYMGCVADNGGWGNEAPSPYLDGPTGGPRRNICVPCNINNACLAGRIFVSERAACIAAGGTAESCCAALAGL